MHARVMIWIPLLLVALNCTPTPVLEPLSVLEVRSYNLRPGTRAEFHRVVVQEAIPLLARWNVDVVGYGPSPHDADSYYLMRHFRSIDDRQRSEDDFYGSEAWINGPRERILGMIESYTTIVLFLDDQAIDGVRAASGR